MAVTLLYAVGTADRGRESVPVMLRPILSVRRVSAGESSFRSRKSITSCRLPKAVRTTETISFRCAKAVMLVSMRSVVTDGTTRQKILMKTVMAPSKGGIFDLSEFLLLQRSWQTVGAVGISVASPTGQRCRPFVRKKSEIKRGIAQGPRKGW